MYGSIRYNNGQFGSLRMFYFLICGCQEPSPVAVSLPKTPILSLETVDNEGLQEILFTAVHVDTHLSHTQFFSNDGMVIPYAL